MITYAILAVLGLVMLIPNGLLVLWPPSTGHFWPWQVVTYALVHVGWAHLLLNSIAFWQLGRWAEREFTRFDYVVLLIACTVGSATLHLLSGSLDPVAGISGTIFGLLTVYAFHNPQAGVWWLLPPVRLSARKMIVALAVVSLLTALTGWLPTIGHWAHLGGIITGYICYRVMER